MNFKIILGFVSQDSFIKEFWRWEAGIELLFFMACLWGKDAGVKLRAWKILEALGLNGNFGAFYNLEIMRNLSEKGGGPKLEVIDGGVDSNEGVESGLVLPEHGSRNAVAVLKSSGEEVRKGTFLNAFEGGLLTKSAIEQLVGEFAPYFEDGSENLEAGEWLRERIIDRLEEISLIHADAARLGKMSEAEIAREQGKAVAPIIAAGRRRMEANGIQIAGKSGAELKIVEGAYSNTDPSGIW